MGGADCIVLSHDHALGYGGAGNDRIIDGAGAQSQYGEDGDDVLLAGAGNDELFGGAGGDALQGGAGADLLDGGNGDDFLDGGVGADAISGGDGRDYILGGGNLSYAIKTSDDHYRFAMGSFGALAYSDGTVSLPPLAGVDPWTAGWTNLGYGVVEGDEGDTIDAGAGEDTVYGGLGEDAILGGDDADHLVGGSEGDYIDGGEGDDTILGDGLAGDMLQEEGMLWFYPFPEIHGSDVLEGGAGDDYLRGDGGADLLSGGEGNDVLAGDADHSRLDARYHGDDELDGGAGNDRLYGQGGNDALSGGEGDDTLMGDDASHPAASHGADMLDGGEGDDLLVGAGGADRLFGGAGNDTLAGDADDVAVEFHGADVLDGEAGEDYLRGFGGDDLLYGGADNDELHGGDGDDWLDGGAGADILVGGTGADTFVVDLDDAVTDAGAGDRIAFAADVDIYALQASLSNVGGQTWTTLAYEGEGGGLLIQGDLATLDLGFVTAEGELLGKRPFLNMVYRDAVRAQGGGGADVLEGYGGDDVLEGGGGSDSLHGGAGDDALAGGAGDDLYTYEIGDDDDLITEVGGTDTLRFIGGITRAEVQIERHGDDLVARLADDWGSVTMAGWYADPASRIEHIEFADGAVGEAELAAMVSLVEGDESDNALAGTPYADVLLGHGGEDALDGAGGNDELLGGEGRDTYRLGFGMGRDRIVDTGENAILVDGGLSFADIDAVRDGEDLLLNVRGDAGHARIVDYFITATPWRVCDGSGGETDTTALIAATQALRENWRALQREEYLAGLRSDFLAPLLAQGYQVQADGSYKRVAYSAADASFTDGTQTDTTTYEWWSTGTSYTSATTRSMDDWNYGNSAGISEYSAVYRVNVLYSNDSVINSSTAYQTTSFGRDTRYVELAWTTTWIGPRIQSTSTVGSGPIYGGSYSQEVVGWSTTVRTTDYIQGRASGRIVDAEPDTYHGIPHYTTLNPRWSYANGFYLTTTQNVQVVRGGDGDSWIYGGDMVDAGGGNDVVRHGGFLYGGAGDDVLEGGEVMAGGDGSDYLEGGSWPTRFLVSAGEGGTDTVWSRGLDSYDFARRFYEALGIEDWEMRQAFGGRWALGLLEGGWEAARFFDSREEAVAYAEQDVDDYYWGLEPSYVEPLTVLPPTAADDYAVLEPLYASGVIEQDTVEFAPDVDPQDLACSWGTWQRTDPFEPDVPADPLRRTLDISVNGAVFLRIVVPNADDAIGAGVEVFRFADGTQLSIREMIALAPPVSNLPVIMGTEGGEALTGSDQAEALLGLGGSDDIQAGAGDDVLDGGTGNDRLVGGAGADTYRVGVGDGIDRLFEAQDEAGIDTIEFGAGITPDMLSLGLGSLLIRIGGNGDELHLEAFDPARAEAGAGIERFRFADGEELGWTELVARGFDIAGSGDDDALSGTSVSDRLFGHEGTDTLAGGTGDDVLDGGGGSDRYVFSRGDGVDLIVEAGGDDEGDILSFGIGIAATDLAWRREGEDLLIEYGPGDAVRIRDWPRQQAALWQLRFADGGAVTVAGLMNAAPLAMQPLEAQTAQEDAHFAYVVPADAFVDPEGGPLAYGAMLADGSALPSWLAFDPTTRTFTGTPENADVGPLDVVVRAADEHGAFAAEPLRIEVGNTNDAPEAAAAIPNRQLIENEAFAFAAAEGAFSDVDAGDVLTYSASLADGSVLPEWLGFDAATGTFSGTPTAAGSFSVRVTVADIVGAEASQIFSLEVIANDLPPVAAADAGEVTEDRRLFAWGNVLANDSDPEGGSLSVADPGIRRGEYGLFGIMPDGNYAYWLDNFSPEVQGLGAGESVVERLSYLASDGTGRSSGELAITIHGANDAPVLARRLADVQLARGAAFSWQVPAGSFRDRDRNDVLNYSATLANGKPLPGWLKFDAATQTFSGTAPGGGRGSIEVRVVASDGHGECSSAEDVFRIALGSRTILPKGNEGVGNGEDPPPPGHGDNWNDGPGAMPGHPGRRRDEVECDVRAPHAACEDWIAEWGRSRGHRQSDRIDAAAVSRWSDPLRDCGGKAGAHRESDIRQSWIRMERALQHLLAERPAGWDGLGQAAEYGGLGGMVHGGRDAMCREFAPVPPGPGADHGLVRFQGLRDGIQRLGWS
ncbi:MAG: hypothetical protein C3F19_06735 [Rhodocyclales bacterium]|nr:MAG: hypothetical protein C3F19_06735 [Rhodocyclales bacterium]